MLHTGEALLIQGVREYVGLITPIIKRVIISIAFETNIVKHNLYVTDVFISEITKWIIEEEIELIYGLFDKSHQHNLFPHCLIHNRLNKELNNRLSRITAEYIKVPRIYRENTICLKVDDFDIYIYYYKD